MTYYTVRPYRQIPHVSMHYASFEDAMQEILHKGYRTAYIIRHTSPIEWWDVAKSGDQYLISKIK